ncbi:angiomotin, putative [Ixodes scapularis]|uniref:Angiomotin, putative n=1 Tax=Ixodes scapularis TaxID=6945 RepID=B7P812_IXOSC|nr:angiomotin, putative [Ixodes scapularis]|eukprot:XP_002400496.1 angiomotin, putative [Ixodes scapularis]
MKAVRSTLSTSYAHNEQVPFYQSSYCQSCSGSETDVSTSNENLSTEERLALRRGERQDPQGEETALTEEEAGSRSNTLVIRNNSSIDGFTSPFYGKLPENGKLPGTPAAPVREITDIPKHYLDQSEVLKHLAKEVHTDPHCVVRKGSTGGLSFSTSHPDLTQLPDHNDSELKKEVSRRDVLIAQLLTQNKELSAEKERKDIELQAQRATLQEQRNHIDILDTALNNAQANVVRLEEECRKKQFYVDRASQLQQALANVQVASERRLLMEKRFRSQLERDVENLTAQKNEGKLSGSGRKDSGDVEYLKRLLREYEEKIIALENEVAKWEQKYLEESTMRQIAVDAASVPKDAKIAALEQTSQESEKLIAQVRSEKLKQMDDLYAAQRKCAEQEGKLKDLESRLAEKDAMIRVLQQHSQEKDAVLQNAVLGRPRHARAASSVTLGSSAGSGGGSTPAHRRTGSKDEIGSSSLSGVVTSETTAGGGMSSVASQSPCTDSKKSIDEQLKEFGSRLSNKESIMEVLRLEKEQHSTCFWRV